MSKSSPFSADDHLDYDASRPIGELDASYRAAKAGKAQEQAGPVKHVPVRDASGSFTNEEAVHAYMMPSKYLTPKVNAKMAPKRPLGAERSAQKSEPVPMYSQVATFGTMPRVRRARTTIPVEEQVDRSWLEQVRHFMQVAAALVIAGALFSWDKLKDFWKLITQYARRFWAALPLTHARTTYTAYRGALVRRMGMKDSRFKVIAPLALLLVVVGLGIFSSLVGENPFAPGKGGNGSNNNTAQQGRAVLNVTPGKGGGANGSSGADNAAAQGGNGGNNPQSAASAGQSTSGAGSAVQSSPSSALGGGVSPVGGYGGGSGSGSTSPTSGGSGSSLPVSVPSVPSTGTVTQPTTSGSSGGSGSGTGSTGNCLCSTVQPVTNTLNNVTQPVTNTVQGVTNQAAPTLNNATAPVTNTTNSLGL